ncbi:hypothetical protein COU78_06620 [Candidatus Peregrinibacteria bacterium CG10_big_fil_rev_8_21_14_0_10_49_24]|nr:MAG: hypothetical protein COV83_00065 [Candidatus Peregrinibacteria bacterium CG11_big_fil_rev_8_21_14_0_20_49_14]PIR50522.1 MAG: hypothetical protein COU78_06620 [Candidatus Peregrinibacteria bacterium CG10_big_fil_rev_8_21_14_0_10_49_24]PJA67811.1 MAG: hypothetical protein CO157_02225 [Candidatus Peregrinibacteria bacterium CG_4_9_14_3_um_filter_49_12]
MRRIFKASPLLPAALCALLLFGCEGNADWRNVEDAVLPQLMEANLKKQVSGLVHKEISRDVDLGYVLDTEKGYSFIKTDDVEAWKITQDVLHKTAMRNLENLVHNEDMQLAESEESANGKYVIVETGDGYDAVRILSQKIQKQMRSYLGDEYFAAVPTRDFLVFWHKDFSLTGEFMEQVEKEYAAGEKYKLTPRLFLVTKEGLQPLIKQAVE